MNNREQLDLLITDMLRARGRYSGTTQTWSIATDPDIARPLLQKLMRLWTATRRMATGGGPEVVEEVTEALKDLEEAGDEPTK